MSESSITIDSRIDDAGWTKLDADCVAQSRLAIEAAARRVEIGRAAVDLLFTSDAHMQRLNAQWRGLDKATDVLSFPAGDAPEQDGVRFLGDIALGLETCIRDAETLEREMAQHVSHLAVHGFLHLLGYDHVDKGDANVMEELEVRILGDLGYPDPYLIDESNTKRAPAR